jgi:phosphopantothenoylcysteine decarboxylase/phosphopantothenate--cysteine ligase
MNVLKNKNILLCITGSIAAYKACELLRLLIKEGANIQVMMSKSAEKFIGVATLAALSNNEVLTNLFPDKPKGGMDHVNLSFELDAIIVAPATANILCKAANGIADEIVSTTLSICDVPILFAPAMNFRMWNNEGTINAVEILKERKNIIVPPEDGQLASLHRGKGRLADFNNIMNNIRKLFNQNLILENKKILITAGPTQEPIDPVRFITNHSSGKMGYAIAKAAKEYGAEVTLISGPVSIANIPGINKIEINTAEQMNNVITNELSSKDFDFIFMAAAVSDYKPIKYSNQKIKSKENIQNLKLEKSIDIMANTISKYKGIKIAFSLETENGEKNAINKMKKKGADYIILNYANEPGAGFNEDTNHVYLFSKNGLNKEFKKNTKLRIAKKLIEYIIDNEN